MHRKTNRYLVIVVIGFGILYLVISIVNHYYFRTFALDLGAYTNALYDYAHFQWNDSSVFNEVRENLLADHFDLYLIIFSPLSLIFKSYTLLIIQILAILFGGIGVYRYFSLDNPNTRIALYACLYFYIFFGVFSAVSYDYHSNVVAASLVPWFFVFLKQRRIIATSLMILIILIGKENIAIWMAFICLGLMFKYYKEPFWRKYLIGSFFFCILYFGLITSVIMPALSENHSYPHFKYSFLGNNAPEAILYLIQHPFESIKALFINHTNDPAGDYVKAELHILVLLSGLPLLIRKPYYFLMLIPIYFQKLYHDNYMMWGIGGQYNIEYAPIFAIGIFSVISEFRNKKAMKITGIVILILALGCTIRVMDNTVANTNKDNIRFYKASHYSRDYSVDKVYKQLSEIPTDAIVSAHSPFLPHLSYRDHIYQFPMINDAEYIIYSEKERPYPLDEDAFTFFTSSLRDSKEWIVEYEDDGLTILKKSSQNKE